VLKPLNFFETWFLETVSAKMHFNKLLAFLSVLSVTFLGAAGQILHVTGSGRDSVRSTRTAVRLAVQKSAPDADAAQNLTAAAIEKVISALNSFGVQQLSTESITLSPAYNYTDTPPRILSYEGISVLSYRVPANRVGKTLDLALQAGANRVDSVENEIEQSRVDGAYLRALEAASRDAERKARRVGEALGVCVGEPASVSVGSSQLPELNGPGAEAATPSLLVAPGQSVVHAAVHVAYSYSSCAGTSTPTAPATISSTASATSEATDKAETTDEAETADVATGTDVPSSTDQATVRRRW
jgi:uncharacterized protein